MGVHGYLVKNCETDELALAIESVLTQNCYYNKLTMQAIKNAMYQKRKNTDPLADNGITKRETEILHLICEEYTAQEIAEKLFLSVRTVEGHRNNLLSKTGAKNTAGLVLFAARNNVLPARALL